MHAKYFLNSCDSFLKHLHEEHAGTFFRQAKTLFNTVQFFFSFLSPADKKENEEIRKDVENLYQLLITQETAGDLELAETERFRQEEQLRKMQRPPEKYGNIPEFDFD